MIASQIKYFYKITVPYIWGYGLLCNLLKKIFTKIDINLVTRIPVKPGIIVDVNLSIGNLKLCDPERCSIAKKLYWTNGNIIPKEDNFALEYFINLAKNSKYIFDIGANSGIFALSSALVNPKAKIFTFDILPESMYILNKNIHINGFSNLIKSNLIGVGANSYFDAPKGNVSSEMPTSVKLDSKYPNIDTIKVEIKTLDDIFTDLKVSDQSCIKIDVEGFEGDIFKNAQKVLNHHRPFILCEVLITTEDYSNYCRTLSENNYMKYLITDNNIKSHDKIIPHERFKDWLFIPKEKSEDVLLLMPK
tara:strand:+ start:5469 stop:6383 length:915 start_codon:yes stop_codon:yes gene_type:complete